GRAPYETLELVRMAGHVDRPAGQRAQESDVFRRLMGSTGPRPVVGGAGADQHGAHALMHEVELDLLEGTLDEEGRIRVHERPQAFQRKPGCDADHQLLADPDVEDPRVRPELAHADLGEDDGDARIVVEELGGDLVEALAHSDHDRTSATTACGRSPSTDTNAASSAS